MYSHTEMLNLQRSNHRGINVAKKGAVGSIISKMCGSLQRRRVHETSDIIARDA